MIVRPIAMSTQPGAGHLNTSASVMLVRWPIENAVTAASSAAMPGDATTSVSKNSR